MLNGCQAETVVGLPWAADSCPWVGKLRTVLPLSDVIRDSAVPELGVSTPAQPPPPDEEAGGCGFPPHLYLAALALSAVRRQKGGPAWRGVPPRASMTRARVSPTPSVRSATAAASKRPPRGSSSVLSAACSAGSEG